MKSNNDAFLIENCKIWRKNCLKFNLSKNCKFKLVILFKKHPFEYEGEEFTKTLFLLTILFRILWFLLALVDKITLSDNLWVTSKIRCVIVLRFQKFKLFKKLFYTKQRLLNSTELSNNSASNSGAMRDEDIPLDQRKG